eukprot:1601424-Alexandrium_andersonii.AAC.1
MCSLHVCKFVKYQCAHCAILLQKVRRRSCSSASPSRSSPTRQVPARGVGERCNVVAGAKARHLETER